MNGIAANPIEGGGNGQPIFPVSRNSVESGPETHSDSNESESLRAARVRSGGGVAAPAGNRAPTTESNPALLEEAVQAMNSLLRSGRGIRFKVAPEGGGFVVQVVDLESDEVIRSIPPEQILSLKQHFQELRGFLLDDSA